jgi:hypothetical protein
MGEMLKDLDLASLRFVHGWEPDEELKDEVEGAIHEFASSNYWQGEEHRLIEHLDVSIQLLSPDCANEIASVDQNRDSVRSTSRGGDPEYIFVTWTSLEVPSCADLEHLETARRVSWWVLISRDVLGPLGGSLDWLGPFGLAADYSEVQAIAETSIAAEPLSETGWTAFREVVQDEWCEQLREADEEGRLHVEKLCTSVRGIVESALVDEGRP